MKHLSVLCGIILLTLFNVATVKSQVEGAARCVNVWDEGCVNGQLQGAGRDDDFVNGNFNPGKRCVNVWDEGCVNGQLPGAGRDDDFVSGGLNPGKRCADPAGRGCPAPPPNQPRDRELAARLRHRLLAKLFEDAQRQV